MSGELAAIGRIRSVLPGPPPGETWIGDDAAVLRAPRGGWLLLAADAVVGGVHADLGLTGLDDLGWKAVAASVSDIAAMGGEPGHAVVTVAAPPGTDLGLLYEGIAAAARRFACPVVGGDLSESSALVVSVAVTGTVDGAPVLRSGARPGDLIWVTGPLGASAAGLRHLRETAAGSAVPAGEAEAALVRAHARPVAAVRAGRAARLAGATAMIDVSDGLATDLSRLAESSGVGVRLGSVPVAPGATLEEALGGGEDFALVFCSADSSTVAGAFSELEPPFRIGRCTSDPHERTLGGAPLPRSGWEHSL